MRKIYLLAILFCFVSIANAQSLLTLDQLDRRVRTGKDTVFVINFWATWCAPCVRELPVFEKFNKEYGGKEKVKVLLISLDYLSTLKTDVQPFLKKKKLKNQVFVLNEKDQQKYIEQIDRNWSGTIPATLFVKNGERKFVEEEFSYIALETEYKNFKSK